MHAQVKVQLPVVTRSANSRFKSSSSSSFWGSMIAATAAPSGSSPF